MANWIDENRHDLWYRVDDCFESLDICNECPNKKACDAIWQIVRQPNKSLKSDRVIATLNPAA